MTKTKLQMCKSAEKRVKGLAGMKDLSAAFMAILTKAISRYTTVHLVFDQFNGTTRERRKSSTGRTSYTCKDTNQNVSNGVPQWIQNKR